MAGFRPKERLDNKDSLALATERHTRQRSASHTGLAQRASDLAQTHVASETAANTDALTGLLLRRALLEVLLQDEPRRARQLN